MCHLTKCPNRAPMLFKIVYYRIMKTNSQMFKSDLRPMFNGSVLMNEAATKDQAVMAAMTKLAEDNFTFRPHPSGTWNISDRH